MKYQDKHAEIQRRYNEFPMKFAFSQKQLDEGLAELGVSSVDDIISIGGGGFIRKTDVDAFNTMVRECANMHETLIKSDDEYVETMFYYELGNHEYCVTYDLADTLNACGLTADEIKSNPRLKKLLAKALEQYKEDFKEWW